MLFDLFKKEKRAQVGGLATFVLTLVVVGFVVAIALTMMDKLGTQTASGWNGTQCAGADSLSCNATHTLTEETAGISDWYGIIVLAVIALVVLSIVMVIRKRAA